MPMKIAHITEHENSSGVSMDVEGKGPSSTAGGMLTCSNFLYNNVNTYQKKKNREIGLSYDQHSTSGNLHQGLQNYSGKKSNSYLHCSTNYISQNLEAQVSRSSLMKLLHIFTMEYYLTVR